MKAAKLARIANVVLGLWLFVSAFVWPHTYAEEANATLVGPFIALTSLAAWTVGPRVQLCYINAALGAWLLMSIVGFPPRSLVTAVHDAIVGALVFVFALIPIPSSTPSAREAQQQLRLEAT